MKIAIVLPFVPLLIGAAAPEPELYILAGQSNMSGRGSIEQLTADERRADPVIRLYGNDGRWKPALDPLDDATGQIDLVSEDKQAAVGPGLFFARRLRALGHAKIDMLPCAKGGTSITRWPPGGGRDTLYGSCVARVGEVQRKPSGMLWYQGESDAETLERANGWKARFEEMARRFRSDLNAPKLPIVLVALSDPSPRADRAARYPGWGIVQAAQQSIALPCTRTVSAAGLKQNDDELHLSTAGQRELGKRIADAMHALRRRGCR